MNEQLEKVIDKLEKAQKVLPAGQLREGCEGVANGLGKVKGPIDKMLKYQQLARDLRKFYAALQKLEHTDIRTDYEGGADAFSDLAEVAGKLGGKAVPAGVGFVGPYFQIIEGSGAIFKMGARLRKQREAQLDPDKYYDDKQREWDRDAAREQARHNAEAAHHESGSELTFDALWGDILMKINRVRRAGHLREWAAIEHKRDDLRVTMKRIAQRRKELAAKHFWED